MNFSLKQLHVFTVLARHENMGTAAQQLFMTKGAISQSLQELERQLGVELFDRVHPRLNLNHDGKRLLPLADEMLQRANDIQLAFSDTSFEHFLNVGASKTIGNHVLPKLIAVFEKKELWLPDVTIDNSKMLCDLVSSFTLDLALLEGEERHPQLVFEPWLKDEMVVVAPGQSKIDNSFTAEGIYPIGALSGQRWILREQDSGSRDYFAHHLAPKLNSYNPVLTLSSPEGILSAVAEGLGLAFISRLTVEHSPFRNSLKIVPLLENFPRQFSLCYHSKKYHSASMQQFLAHCRGWNYPA